MLGLAPTIILYLALVTSTSFLEIWEPPKMTNVSSTCTIVGIILHRISTQYASIKSKFVRRGVHLPLTFSGLPCSQSGQWFTPEKINLQRICSHIFGVMHWIFQFYYLPLSKLISQLQTWSMVCIILSLNWNWHKTLILLGTTNSLP